MPFRSRRYSPAAARGVPVQRRSRVVSTPVQAESAVKIQKVLRGFLVRKGVKKVLELRIEVDVIEKRIEDEEVVDLMRRPESKERVKLIEGLMSLLFRLDSVRGVDHGVRGFRKATIEKVIALQEAIDSIVGGDGDGADPTVGITENSNAWSSESESVVVQRMVEQVVEKNKEQSRLISSLSRRMEVLEKAFLCQKLNKAKKTRLICKVF